MPKPLEPSFDLSCPLPLTDYQHITLAHGGGGRLSRDLLRKVFLPLFDNPYLAEAHDGAVLEVGGVLVAFTSDTYVISPLFFPGGNIGHLAVNGTVNDLACCGAEPLALSVGFVLEEGMPVADLHRIAVSVREAAAKAGVVVVTGDTKVVERGKGDGVYLNTSGVGLVPEGRRVMPAQVRPGDKVILSGSIGDHGVAILSVREGLQFETQIVSDTAPLNGLASVLFESGADVHCLRDPTRGGVASATNEIADKAGVGIALDEAKILVREEVRGACEILGLDPLYVANEGKLLAFVPPEDADRALAAWRGHLLGAEARVIGEVVEEDPGLVTLRSLIGGRRVVDMMTGEQLPRIC